MSEKETAIFCPSGKKEWREWLQQNHDKEQSVWVICHPLKSGVPSISWSDSVDEALCFGWIDGKRQPDGDGRFRQFFCRRKPKSGWSKINKAKVQRLTEEGLMTVAGLACIETAKQNGSWILLDDVEELLIPKDLEKAFKAHKGSKDFFMGLSKSVKKMMLQWIVLAKRPETRANRIAVIAESAAQGLKPKQF